MSPTIPKSAQAMDGAQFANAWLAATSAVVRSKADRRLDRSLVIHRYDEDGHPAGLLFVGTSADLVVMAGVPFINGPVGPEGLRTLVDTPYPVESWAVDDAHGVGAQLVRSIKTAASEVAEKGGVLKVTVTADTYVAPGTLGDATGQMCLAIAFSTWRK